MPLGEVGFTSRAIMTPAASLRFGQIIGERKLCARMMRVAWAMSASGLRGRDGRELDGSASFGSAPSSCPRAGGRRLGRPRFFAHTSKVE